LSKKKVAECLLSRRETATSKLDTYAPFLEQKVNDAQTQQTEVMPNTQSSRIISA